MHGQSATSDCCAAGVPSALGGIGVLGGARMFVVSERRESPM